MKGGSRRGGGVALRTLIRSLVVSRSVGTMDKHLRSPSSSALCPDLKLLCRSKRCSS